MLRLDGKVALVTGAGSVGPGWGNGKATAALLARQGAAVLAVDIHAEAVAETLSIIHSEGGNARAHVADVTSFQDVSQTVAACIAAFGQLDILVNNVGGSSPGGTEGMAEADWESRSPSISAAPSWTASAPSPSEAPRHERHRQPVLDCRPAGERGSATCRLRRREMHIPTDPSRAFRRKPAGDSGRSQPPIPRQPSRP